MKVLLDENLPHKLRTALIGHDVFTAGYVGWNGLKNDALLRQAEENGIQVFVTGDRSLHFEQNLEGRKIAIISLSAQTWKILRGHSIQRSIDMAESGTFTAFDCGLFHR